jgi:hypothetical protein
MKKLLSPVGTGMGATKVKVPTDANVWMVYPPTRVIVPPVPSTETDAVR